MNDRGRRDAPRMGERLARRGIQLDLILSSPALRALATAEILARKLDYRTKNIVVEERLYASTPGDLLDVIQGLGEKPKRVMVVGHNPELAELAHRLSDAITDMPTCAVAEFIFAIKSWSNVGKQAPSEVNLCTPKQ